ncbi:MAG: CDP-glycerol glycerophosphotransferase family protein [Deltaproteobacteria bacterium]|uniref:CDP-glycerol glycerophosphotransferase family protein n=1 Tax=Candidatus Zymogenus saltonus TaxID=2844893 RepID=A0A9D8KET5_9DELT|nr:CDP-glycerol glycerophosphotransferase family protein [Candidatus Zymogenus saltonus]
MKKRAHILFIPFHRISLLEMMPIALKLVEDGIYAPLFLLRSSAFSRDDAAMVKESGMEVYSLWDFFRFRFKNEKKRHEKKAEDTSKMESSPQGKSGQFKKRMKSFFRFFMPEILWETLKYIYRILEAHLLYRQKRIFGLVVISDTLPGVEPPFIKVANRYNIPSLIVPFSLITPMGTAKIRLLKKDYKRNYSLKSIKNRLASRFFPTWVYEYEGEKMLAHPVSWALASRIVGVFPDQPWSICGGEATLVAVENGFVYDLFKKQGVPEKKMVLTGKPSMDAVYCASQKDKREVILRELGLSERDKVLLCAVPQLAEHEIMSWEKHWKEIEFLLSTFMKFSNMSVVLSLHPRSNLEDYRKLSEKYRATIAGRRIYELLPIADVFVATFSTTVMYAVGIGTPTVVVDFYSLGYDIYDNLPGVKIVREIDKLAATLHHLNSGVGKRIKMKKEDERRWILLDGKCTDRIAEELYCLAEKE